MSLIRVSASVSTPVDLILPILSDVMNVKSCTCGIYYLTDGLDVIYVGASTNVERRVQEHASQIDFSQVFVDECSPKELPVLEAQAIREFRPPLNEANSYE